MKNETKAQLTERNRLLSRALGAYQWATKVLATKASPDYTRTIILDGYTYDLALYGSLRSFGGIVITTIHSPGESAWCDVDYLDDYIAPEALDRWEFRDARDMMMRVRRNLMDAAISRCAAQRAE
jgi:hypothetical protein